MTKNNFARVFEQFNAPQIRADRSADRAFNRALIARLTFAAVSVALAFSFGVV